jgi:hypothetical protein
MRNMLLGFVGVGWLLSMPFTEFPMFNNPTFPGFNPIGAFMFTVVAGIAAVLVALLVKPEPPDNR